MENTIKNSWRDVTINEYFDLVDRLEDEGLNDYDKEVIKVSFTTGKSEDEIWSLNINQFRDLQVQSLWLDKFKINEGIKFNKIEINGEKYKIDTNLQNFTVAQYIDFQNFYPKFKSNKRTIGYVLACFIIPVGKNYAEDYDIQEVVSLINEHLDILTANEIMFFFLKQYLISMRVTVNYFNWILKRVKKKIKNKEKLTDLEMKWSQMKRLTLDGLRSLTM